MKRLLSIQLSALNEVQDSLYAVKIAKGTRINDSRVLLADAQAYLDQQHFIGQIGGRAVLNENAKFKLNYQFNENREEITVDAKTFSEMLNDRWTSFIISKKQMISSWTNKQGIKRASIIIPSNNPKYEGCSFIVNYNCLKDVASNENIYKVAVPSTYEFRILKPQILGTSEDGKNVYGESQVVDSLYGHQLKSLFKLPEKDKKISQEIGSNQTLPDQMGNIEIDAGADGIFGTADDIISPDNSAMEIEENMQNGQGIVR